MAWRLRLVPEKTDFDFFRWQWFTFGGSIALIHAAAQAERVAGVVVLAPHEFVEEKALEGIARAGESYLNSDWPQRLGRSMPPAQANLERAPLTSEGRPPDPTGQRQRLPSPRVVGHRKRRSSLTQYRH